MWFAGQPVTAADGVALKKLRFSVNGIDYAAVEAGEGPLLLLSHGTLGGKALFSPLIERLAPRFRCVAFDWRGHGESGFNAAGWTHRDLVADLRVLIEALDEGSAILVGVSQGGAISTRLALDHPECVRAVVNMCAGSTAPPPAGLDRFRAFAAILAHEPDEERRRTAAREFASAVFHAPGFSEREPKRFNEEVDIILSHRRDAVELLLGVPANYDDIFPRLHEISCPYLVIWGECDGRPAMGKTMADAIPGAELVMVPDAGHHVNVDAPDACAAAIGAFVGRTA